MLHGLYTWVLTRTSELSNERGATAVEYGLMVALIAAVIVAVVAFLGEEINAAFQTVLDAIGG
jgi:pilus assembly protein Flp/PilA